MTILRLALNINWAKKNMIIKETELTEKIAEQLIALSEDWEQENSCFYRKNDLNDLEGKRIFLAMKNDKQYFGGYYDSKNKNEQ